MKRTHRQAEVRVENTNVTIYIKLQKSRKQQKTRTEEGGGGKAVGGRMCTWGCHKKKLNRKKTTKRKRRQRKHEKYERTKDR